jgi:hypothetical protein
MKLATITLAVAFALATTFAMAEGTLNYSTPAARPVARGLTLTRPVAIRSGNLSGNTLAPIVQESYRININSVGHQPRRLERPAHFRGPPGSGIPSPPAIRAHYARISEAGDVVAPQTLTKIAICCF